MAAPRGRVVCGKGPASDLWARDACTEARGGTWKRGLLLRGHVRSPLGAPGPLGGVPGGCPIACGTTGRRPGHPWRRRGAGWSAARAPLPTSGHVTRAPAPEGVPGSGACFCGGRVPKLQHLAVAKHLGRALAKPTAKPKSAAAQSSSGDDPKEEECG